MATDDNKHRKLHHDLSNVGLRAQATAVGLVQLCLELRRANVIDEPAIDRIKVAIADQVSLSAPRSVSTREYRRDIKARLDRLFAGEEQMGSAEALAFGATQD